MLMKKVSGALFLFVCVWLFRSSAMWAAAASTLTTSPTATDGVLTVCPGESISIICSHDNVNSGVSRWIASGIASMDCDVAVSHGIPEDTTCGLFTITMISDSPNPPFSSTAQTTATEALNGAVVECFSSGLSTSLVGNITINVLSIPTPTIDSVVQVSQSVVRVNMSVSDSQCVGSYQVEATPVGGSESTNISSPTSTVNASGLNVCQYNYTLVGFLLTTDGIPSDPSSPVSFSGNLSVLNGITVTVDQVDPLIEWEQMDNHLYPTCITGYVVSDQISGLSTTVSSLTRSLTAQQLIAAGFPYCTTIHPIVTPVTLMGPLETVSRNIINVTLNDPDFPVPALSLRIFRNAKSNTTQFTFFQNTSVIPSMVPVRTYQYTVNRNTSSIMNFSSSFIDLDFSGEEIGATVLVTVSFQNGVCESAANINVTVPSFEMASVIQEQPSNTSHSVTVTLPLTEYRRPERIDIQATAETNSLIQQSIRITTTPSPSTQYTVVFADLEPATEYTFAITFTIRSNDSVFTYVTPAYTGSFITQNSTATVPPMTVLPTTQGPPSPIPSEGCDIICIAGIVVAAVVVFLALILCILVIIILSMRSSCQTYEVNNIKRPSRTPANTMELT